MIQRLLRAIRERSKPTEDASEPGGFLSYAGEWHALTIGLGAGTTAAVMNQPIILASMIAIALGISGVQGKRGFKGRGVVNELRREPWYAVGSGLVGYVVMGGRLASLSGLLPV
jgi:hypothetical protein